MLNWELTRTLQLHPLCGKCLSWSHLGWPVEGWHHLASSCEFLILEIQPQEGDGHISQTEGETTVWVGLRQTIFIFRLRSSQKFYVASVPCQATSASGCFIPCELSGVSPPAFYSGGLMCFKCRLVWSESECAPSLILKHRIGKEGLVCCCSGIVIRQVQKLLLYLLM